MTRLLEGLKLVYRKGLVHILAGSFMTKLVAFFGSVFLVRVLSKEELGILGYLENIYGYVLVIAGMGMSNAILRYIILGKSDEEKYGYYRYCTGKGTAWNIVLGLIMAGVFFLYPHPERYGSYTWLLNVMFFMLPFQYLTDSLLCNERAMFANQRYAVFSLSLSAAVILGKVLFGFLGGIRWVVAAQLAVYVTMGAIMYVSGRRRYFTGVTPALPDRSMRREIDRYALQYMITNGLWTVFMLNDTFLLGRFCSPDVLAEYKVAYTIPGCVNLVSTAIGVFVAPYFVRHEEDYPWIRQRFKMTFLLNAGAVGLLCLAIGLLSKPVVWLLYGEQYMGVVPVMRLLLLAAFINCGMRYTCANLLATMGKIKYNMAVSVAAILLQLGVNLFVVPRYGAVGVAITSCGVYLFMAAALLLVFMKIYFWDK